MITCDMSFTKFSTQIDEDVLKKLKEFTRQSDKSISQVVSEAIDDYLQKIQMRPAFRSAVEDVLQKNKDLLERLAK